MNGTISTAIRSVALAALSVCLAFSPARAVSPPPDGDYGAGNTAEGGQALFSLTTGAWNTALGFQALFDTNSGGSNTATGVKALFNNTAGSNNAAYGVQALFNNTVGSSNIALGNAAGYNVTGNFNIDIGSTGLPDESNTIRIGTKGKHLDVFFAGIFDSTAPSGSTVFISSDGHLGTVTSSARFKEEIKPMNTASESIFALKPVTFRYKKDIDPNGLRQFGLVAEEVAKTNPELVVRNAEGELHSVRYEAVNAMLLNEFLKEHQMVQDLKATVAMQEKKLETFLARLKEQEAQIQKVSAQLAVGKPAPQIVENR